MRARSKASETGYAENRSTPPSPILKTKGLLHDSTQSITNKGVICKVLQTNKLGRLFMGFGGGMRQFFRDSLQSIKNKWVICKVLLSKNLAGRFLR